MIPSSRETIWPTERYPSIELSDREHLSRLGIDPDAPIKKKETKIEKEAHEKKPEPRVKEEPKKDAGKPDKAAVARVQKKR